jgi:hypothetical protein
VPGSVGKFAHRLEAGLAEGILKGKGEVDMLGREANRAEEFPPLHRKRRGPRNPRHREISGPQSIGPGLSLGRRIGLRRSRGNPGQPGRFVDVDPIVWEWA